MKFIVRKKSKVERTELDGEPRVDMVLHLCCADGVQGVSFIVADPSEYERVKLGDEYELRATQ